MEIGNKLLFFSSKILDSKSEINSTTKIKIRNKKAGAARNSEAQKSAQIEKQKNEKNRFSLFIL